MASEGLVHDGGGVVVPLVAQVVAASTAPEIACLVRIPQVPYL